MIDKYMLMGLGAKEIIQSLTMDDVERFLRAIGVEKIERHSTNLVLPTICHNPLDKAKSMKLYYYDNYKVFHCFTQCGESMSIITLYCKFMELNYHKISKAEACDYIKNFITTGVITNHKKKNINIFDEEQYQYHSNLVTLDTYPAHTMDMFVKYYPTQWLEDGITKEAMDKYNIRWSISQDKIIIPHYDIDNNLVGIRCRAFNEEEIENYGKYHPVTVGDTMYSHPLSYNLYGINQNKNAISKLRRAILVEGEKSVLLGDKYMGENNICVAVCGSQINKYQIALLTEKLNVNEIIIAFDKDFESDDFVTSRKCRDKIRKQCYKYRNDAIFYYIFDEENLLQIHQSPLDKDQETWEKLLRGRIKI